MVWLRPVSSSCFYNAMPSITRTRAVISGVLISQDFLRLMPQTINPNISGITSSCFGLGAFFGAITAFTVGERLGRKRTILLGLVTNTVGAVLQISAFSLPQFIVGRIINGYGMGMFASSDGDMSGDSNSF